MNKKSSVVLFCLLSVSAFTQARSSLLPQPRARRGDVVMPQTTIKIESTIKGVIKPKVFLQVPGIDSQPTVFLDNETPASITLRQNLLNNPIKVIVKAFDDEDLDVAKAYTLGEATVQLPTQDPVIVITYPGKNGQDIDIGYEMHVEQKMVQEPESKENITRNFEDDAFYNTQSGFPKKPQNR